jgi:hypothetical protein
MWAAGAYGTPNLYGGDLVLYAGDVNASGNDGTGVATYSRRAHVHSRWHRVYRR